MAKKTKKDMSKTLNAYLQTDINFTKLSEKELTTLVNIFNDPVDLGQRYAKAQALLRVNDRVEQGRAIILETINARFGG